MEASENVTGEKRFSSDDVTFDRPTYALAPTGDYELKIMGDKTTVKAPSEAKEDSVPYVNTQMEIVAGVGNTTYETAANGRNVRIFPSFFLKTQPVGASNFVAVKSKNSITGLAKALGETLNVSVQDFVAKSGTSWEILNPLEVAAWLKSKDGLTVKAHIKQVKGDGTYKDKNEIAYFIMD